MATPADKLAQSLDALKALQDTRAVAIRASDLTRVHRERLLRNGFIREVMKGWYIPARPDGAAGESTDWYASFWPFCAAYLTERFADDWCLGAEHSIALHTGNWNVPRQLLVRATRGGNKPTGLLHDTSIFDLRLEVPAAADLEVIDGLRIMRLPAALITCAPGHFAAHPVETRAALAMIADASDVLSRLLDGGHSSIAGRLAGAFRNIGRPQIAEAIVSTMKSAGYTVHETDPFADRPPVALGPRETSPAVNRLRMSWATMRHAVLQAGFPPPPGLPRDVDAYLHRVEDGYVTDAYHSLSIEGYRVSAELIERVRSGHWNPDSEADRSHRDALAARGYWLAFQKVRDTVRRIAQGANAGEATQTDHGAWYRELFGPGVAAGLLKPGDLAGYRNGPVYIRQSMHVPPRAEAVRALMPALFDLLRDEPDVSVRVVLGHFFFVNIHPYFDGNGRMGRFLMNAMLASGGYPWTVIPVTERTRYMSALEAASVQGDIRPFAGLVAERVARG
ncbi:MAG TPA: Fic family protein [Quisquiliibacterium sp.]|nr:Fic family protein [Quisquiliibacterium sp.]HPA90883.1 Fic family protein [Quisquiliibacterium sp.]HQD81514.1 Fic family protein [Quisquiliibacterium sp.]HQN11857.1 Fic family protein [Quisquiliibacterium sp.]